LNNQLIISIVARLRSTFAVPAVAKVQVLNFSLSLTIGTTGNDKELLHMTSRKRANAVSARGRLGDPASSAFRIVNYPFYRMARVCNLYAACLDYGLKPRGMDQPRWRVLMILSEHNPAAMGLIAEMAVMKLPTVVKLLQRMQQEGLVRTAPRASDQRVSEVSITAVGRRGVTFVKQAASGVYAEAVASLGRAQLARLNAILRELENNLQRSQHARRRVA
jgi:DNA-binding MarR family transcriptional regulator